MARRKFTVVSSKQVQGDSSDVFGLASEVKGILRKDKQVVTVYDFWGNPTNQSLPIIYSNKGAAGVTIKACYPKEYYTAQSIREIADELSSMYVDNETVSVAFEEDAHIAALHCTGCIIRVKISTRARTDLSI